MRAIRSRFFLVPLITCAVATPTAYCFYLNQKLNDSEAKKNQLRSEMEKDCTKAIKAMEEMSREERQEILRQVIEMAELRVKIRQLEFEVKKKEEE